MTFIEVLIVKNDFFIIYNPEKYWAKATVLPQISGTQASIAQKFNGGITLFNDETIIGILLNTLVSWIIQWIWGQMADMSFLTILSLVSITVPGIAKVIQSALYDLSAWICKGLTDG